MSDQIENCPSCRIGLWSPDHVHYTDTEHREHIAHSAVGVKDAPGCSLCTRWNS